MNYNPPINFRVLSMDTTYHAVPKLTVVINDNSRPIERQSLNLFFTIKERKNFIFLGLRSVLQSSHNFLNEVSQLARIPSAAIIPWPLLAIFQ